MASCAIDVKVERTSLYVVRWKSCSSSSRACDHAFSVLIELSLRPCLLPIELSLRLCVIPIELSPDVKRESPAFKRRPCFVKAPHSSRQNNPTREEGGAGAGAELELAENRLHTRSSCGERADKPEGGFDNTCSFIIMV